MKQPTPADNTTPPAAPAKKRVLVVSQHFWPENFRISDIAAGFVQNGMEVDVLCGLPNYPKGEWFEGYGYFSPRRQQYKGAEVFRCGEIRRRGNTPLLIFLNYCSFPFFALFNLWRLHGRRYDAVFCYETSPVLMILPAIVYAKIHRTPLTTYVLDLWPENLYSVLPIKSRFWRGAVQRISNWHYRQNTRLIAMSDKLAEMLTSRTGGKSIDIATIPQYCEDFYANPLQDTALQKRFKDSFNILFAGNISPAQDLENLVLAMKKVREMGVKDVRCLIVGDGMSRADLEAFIAQQGVQDLFIFCGACPPEDIPRWTGIADALFAGLAKSENLGLTVPGKITSYFAAGRPMLVAADGEAARVSEESGAALTSPAGDSDALAQNILALYGKTAAQRAAMGRAGKNSYTKHYSRTSGLRALQDFILFGNSPS